MISSLLFLGAHAVVAGSLAAGNSQAGCPLRLTVNGAVSGPIGQVVNGQIRAGTGLETANFELHEKRLVDGHGRGCRWRAPTGVLQCDGEGHEADGGFTVGCDGVVRFNGQASLYKCGTEMQHQHSINLEPKGVECAPVTLQADSCHQEGCPNAPPAAQSTSTAPRQCPADLSGPFEFPHLIVPVDKTQPDKVGGTSYYGEASATVSSIFTFDIPASDRGKTCSLVFLFPQQPRLEPSSFAGASQVQFTLLRSPASEKSTSYNTRPAEERLLREMTVVPGNNYTVDSFGCPAGGQVSVQMSSVGGTKMKYLQDSISWPIGLYITKC